MKHWDEILAHWSSQVPCAPARCFLDLLWNDEELAADLQRNWSLIPYWKRRTLELEHVWATVYFILFWRVMGAASKYQHEPLVLPHGWANKYWSDPNLQGELKRAIKAVAKDDGLPGSTFAYSQLPGGGSDAGPVPDFARDYLGRGPAKRESESTTARDETDEDNSGRITAALARLKRELPDGEWQVIDDWYRNGANEEKRVIAARHGLTLKQLDGLLKKATSILKSKPGKQHQGGVK